MRIQPSIIRNIVSSNNPHLIPKQNKCLFSDVFVRSRSSLQDDDLLQTYSINPISYRKSKSILSKVRKFNIDDYFNLTAVEKAILINSCSETLKKTVFDNLEMALKMRSYLDKKYGKNNYIFVSVGTSPSGIARVFEFMGTETKYLPMSGLRGIFSDRNINKTEFNIDLYGKLLKEQNLSKEEIEKSKKKYLFFDYTASGRSLKKFGYIMREFYDINSSNVSFLSLNSVMYHMSRYSESEQMKAADYETSYLWNSGIEKYGGISSLPYNKITPETIDQCKKFSSKEAKLYNFLLMDLLNKKGLLKINQKNKNIL